MESPLSISLKNAMARLNEDSRIDSTFDAQVATTMWVQKKLRIVTSPNAYYIPLFPELEEEFGFAIRTDGHWGGQEYSRWPQLVTHITAHLACIPKKGATFFYDDYVELCVWNDITSHLWIPDDVNQTALETGVGRLHSDALRPLRRAVASVRPALEKVIQSAAGEVGNAAVFGDFLLRTVQELLQRLANSTDTKVNVILAARSLQRTILECYGFITYRTTVIARSKENKNWDTLPVLGCFTDSPSNAAFYFRVGVPVWLIRSSIHPDNTVQKIMEPINWRSAVHDGVWTARDGKAVAARIRVPNLRSVEGTLTLDSGIRNLIAAILNVPVSSLLPQGSARAATQTATQRTTDSAPRHAPTPSMNKTSNFNPQKKRKRPAATKPNAQANDALNHSLVYIECQGIDGEPDAPPPVDYWEEALRSVSPIVSKADLIDDYYFPPPWTIISRDNPERNARCYRNTIRILPYLYRIAAGAALLNVRPIRCKDWRIICFGDYYQKQDLEKYCDNPDILDYHKELPKKNEPIASSSSSSQLKATNPGQQKLIVRDGLLRTAFGYGGKFVPYKESLKVMWRGKRIEHVDVNVNAKVRHEVQWYLSESSFRAEILDIVAEINGNILNPGNPEKKASMAKIVKRLWENQPKGDDDIFPPFTDAEKHIFYDEWVTPVHPSQVSLFHILCRKWPDFPPEREKYDHKTAGQAETDNMARFLASFYVKTFVKTFGRLPSVPRCVPESIKNTRLFQ